MRRVPLILLVGLLFVPALTWARGEGCFTPSNAGSADFVVGDRAETGTAREPVFVFLGHDLQVGDQVRFSVQVEGRERFTQELEVIPHPVPWSEEMAEEMAAALPVLELFPARPERLRALERKSRDQRVEVSVHRNDELALTASLADLVHEGEMLRAQAIQPMSVRFQETRTAQPASAPFDSASSGPDAKRFCIGCTCLQQCDWNQDRCYRACDNFNPDQACYDKCDRNFLDCQGNCGFCQPSSTTTTQQVHVGTTILTPSECHHVFTSLGPVLFGYHRQIRVFFNQVTTTTTVHPDCTRTVTTTVVSLPPKDCWNLLQATQSCTSLGPVNQC